MLSRKQFEERCRFPLEIVPDWESHNVHADMSGKIDGWRSGKDAARFRELLLFWPN